jgi:hypothetical protein
VEEVVPGSPVSVEGLSVETIRERFDGDVTVTRNGQRLPAR